MGVKTLVKFLSQPSMLLITAGCLIVKTTAKGEKIQFLGFVFTCMHNKS